ncbi:MAG: serine hydrolase [Rhizobiaceae bacterium]|nr:serine hydrolase [Rhizobiaceae bacterium]
MRILKWLGGIVLALVLIGAVLAFFNWEKLVRLNTVNTLFSEELIVSNFSSMDKAFFHVPVPAEGEVEAWEEEPKTLPTSFESAIGTKDMKQWLEETQTTSLLVLQDGKIAFEEYYLGTGPDDLRVSWSVAKSFLSAAFGIAVNEGLIDLEAPVDSYVSDFKGSAYEGVSVRDVLTMSSGVTFNEDYLDFWSDINKMGRVLALGGSMDDFASGLTERTREAGKVRQYVSIDTHVLAMVLRAATGQTLPQYVAEKIISPIGFEKQPFYLSDSEENAFALGGLNVTTRDYARFGQVFLDNGKWQGKQILPAGWVVSSTLEQANRPETEDGFGYGYQWWIPDGSVENGGDYQARGIYGQFIHINPKTRTVIVRTAANRKFREDLGGGLNAKHIHVDMFRAIANHMDKQ